MSDQSDNAATNPVPRTSNAELHHMFDGYSAAKHKRRPAWAGPLLGGAAVFHAILFISMWVKTVWAIEMLDRPSSPPDIAMAAPPPPPPPPPPGGARPQEQIITPKKKTVKDIVQPIKVEKQEVKPQVTDDSPAGEEGGEVGGVAGGVVGGDINGVMGAPPPPPPPPPAAPTVVPPTMLEGSRIRGDKTIVPDDVTKTEIQRSGKDKVIGSFKLCLSATGDISSVTMLKSTGFSAYDGKISSTMRAEWGYKPYMVNGKAVPVCTAVTFIYSQK